MLDDLAWFSRDFALDHSIQKDIDVSLCCFKSYNFLVIFTYWKWNDCISFEFFLWFIVPVPAMRFHFCFRHREIFVRNSFIVAKRGKLWSEKLSPLSCRHHMTYDFLAESLIFLNRIWCIEDTVLFADNTSREKYVFGIFHNRRVHDIFASAPCIVGKNNRRTIFVDCE